MICPDCGSTNHRQAVRCSECGYDFTELLASELRRTTDLVQTQATDPWAWIEYADALYSSKRLQEARSAIDKALPLFNNREWALYFQAAGTYNSLGDYAFARRLLADGTVYYLENHRDLMSLEDIENAGKDLRVYAHNEALREFQKMTPEEREAERLVNGRTPKNPRPDLDGLGTYQLAVKLSVHPANRLYPGSAQMSAAASSPSSPVKSEGNQRLARKILIGVAVLIMLVLVISLLLGQCHF